MGWLTDYITPAQDLASKGRFGDTMLAHINPEEAALLKALGGSGTTNPQTGLPEFFSLDDIGSADSDFVSGAGDLISSGADTIGNAASDLVSGAGDVVSGTGNAISDTVSGLGNTLSNLDWTSLRDSLEAAGVVAGNYFLPGSGMITGQMVSDGAKQDLGSDVGRLAMLGSGVSGGVNGNSWGTSFDAASSGQGSNILENSMATGDNIDVGGGWSPAGAENMPDNIDIGGGYNPATGGTSTPWDLSKLGSSALSWMKSNPMKTAKIGSSLYDMYAKNQMAKQLGQARQQQQDAVNNFYAPGSAEYNRLQQQLQRKAAAGGHSWSTSQFGADLAGAIADKKMQALTSNARTQNELLAQQLGSKYTSLGSLFKNMPELLK